MKNILKDTLIIHFREKVKTHLQKYLKKRHCVWCCPHGWWPTGSYINCHAEITIINIDIPHALADTSRCLTVDRCLPGTMLTYACTGEFELLSPRQSPSARPITHGVIHRNVLMVIYVLLMR